MIAVSLGCQMIKAGDAKLVERCTYPLTACGVVSRIYTDLAVIDVEGEGYPYLEWYEDDVAVGEDRRISHVLDDPRHGASGGGHERRGKQG